MGAFHYAGSSGGQLLAGCAALRRERRIERGYGRQELLGVWLLGVAVHLVHLALLDEPTPVA